MATYYIDSDSGSDSNNGTGTGTAWKTIDKFIDLSTLAAGDKAILRRGRSTAYSSGGAAAVQILAKDGDFNNPIIIEADYGDSWSDFGISSQSYTATFGSKTLTASTTITGISVGDWIYNSTDGDNSKDFAYDVAAVSGSTLTLHLPFKGSTGSGKTLKVMGSAPKFNSGLDTGFSSSAYRNLRIVGRKNWLFQGLHLTLVNQSDDIAGQCILFDQSSLFVFKDCFFRGNNHSGSSMIKVNDDCSEIILRKCRGRSLQSIDSVGTKGAFEGSIYDCLFDGKTNVNYGVYLGTWDDLKIHESEFISHNTADIRLGGGSDRAPELKGRNIKFGATGDNFLMHGNTPFASVKIEDYDNVKGDTQQFSTFNITVTGDPIIQSNTSVKRSNDFSIKVNPPQNLSTNWDFSRIKFFEIPIYATTAARTYKIYFNSSATANWTANPTASELWIEIEHWGHASNNFRTITKSTGTVNFTGSTAWQSLSVTATSAQAGMAYLRAYYAKGKESSKSNLFYVDPLPEVS